VRVKKSGSHYNMCVETVTECRTLASLLSAAFRGIYDDLGGPMNTFWLAGIKKGKEKEKEKDAPTLRKVKW